ncbi:S-layer homology domain-containing protein [Papillibacter cinnamivorans]|uniref:S-layer homology domain-containing protein n=1 Tax=Papillibacter cinnamivorans DSM 12816 TaxID=1122930 RepID=A0A1W1YL94_9FIRM|nr:S-layer homology domain-containing protein [Papillibacter cinnamivorans]SMC36892.1 S-layer homology domain-containing protein [Papillibacter cinnamivorans DSM 12816]
MFKKTLSVVLALSLILSMSLSALAAGYSDLTGHWAKAYMEDLAEKGYFTGYSDGTMRPDNDITVGETLALLSRFYSPDAETADLIYSDYETFLNANVPSSFSWLYDELSICLASGILTESELKNLDLSAKIEKELLAVYLVRTMQLSSQAESLSGSVLSFGDVSDISSDCRGSVAVLSSAGIVTGDNANRFSPHSSVTRAVAAAMISRSLDYLGTLGKSLSIEGYDGLARTYGIIYSVQTSGFVLRSTDGSLREFAVPSSASVTVDGASGTLGSSRVGCYATVTEDKGTVTKVAVEGASSACVQGVVSSVSYTTTANSSSIYVWDPKSGSYTNYTVSDDADIRQNGKDTSLSSVTSGYFITLRLENGVVSELFSEPLATEITGNISSISYGTTVTLKMMDDNYDVYCFYLDISDLPDIYRGSSEITLDRLSAGDEITVSMSGYEVVSITAKVSENTVTGELTSINSTTGGTQWTIKTSDGTSVTYSLDEYVVVYKGSTSILLSDVQAGDTVTVVIYGSTITEVHLESAAVSSSKVTGTVLSVDTKGRTVTILTASNKLIYIDVTYIRTIVSAATGESILLTSVAADSEIVAYGSYGGSTAFSAVLIVVEG